MKRLAFALYVLVVAAMGMATIVEKNSGTEYAKAHIYGAWWFSLLWGVLTAVAIFIFIRRRVRVPSAVALHTSLVLILAGALLTHLFSTQGAVHLRQGVPTTSYFVPSDNEASMEERTLPFTLQLDTFNVVCHAGTTAPSDYETHFTLRDGDTRIHGLVSMNNIFSHRGFRLYQSSYDEDGRGSILALNRDRWGIPVTYAGYALLFLSLLWMLIDPRGSYRRLLRSPLLRKGTLALALFFGAAVAAQAVPALPKSSADHFGHLYILYNNRICPAQTFALDFTKKLYGKTTYKGLTAEQVLTGFIFYGNDWSAEPLLRVKGGQLKLRLHLPDYASVNQFFNTTTGGYVLGPLVQEYFQGNRDKLHTQAAELDDKLQLIMELRQGLLLKLFPYTLDGVTTWYGPTDKYPDTIAADNRLYMQSIFSLLYADVLAGKTATVDETFVRMRRYQQKFGGASLPTDTQVKCERLYNRVPFATILFMVNLTLGFLTLGYEIVRLTRRRPLTGWCGSRVVGAVSVGLMTLSFLALTLCEALRWVVSGKVPMANGYETMLFVAWLVMLASLLACRRFRIVLTFGFLMSGFFLLVSHIGQMDPSIGHVMPVLNSPLLSVHVSIIMTGFALFSLTFICGLTALVLKGLNRSSERLADQLASLQLLSQLFLYPAQMFLGIGIFVGAIWANVSWGNYWSWDPKETWALITFMVYAAAFHPGLLPALRRPLPYHVFMTLAFLTLLMTYFGVNYFLGGMHSYA